MQLWPDGRSALDYAVMFKWICLSAAVIFAVVLLVLVGDLKRDVTQSLDTANTAVSEATEAVGTVNEKLPEIVTEVQSGTEMLALLAEDVALIKSLAGIDQEQQERGVRGLATYADDLQKVLVEQTAGQGVVVMKEKVIGKKLEEIESIEEFLVGLSKEMVTLVLLAKSKQEILDRACHSSPPRRTPFFLKFPDREPIRMIEYLRQNHPESAALPPFER